MKNQYLPQSTLQEARDLVYQGKGSIIPLYRNHFDWDSLWAARFTDTHEGVPDVLDLIAFSDPEEKRYLIEMHLGTKELPEEMVTKIRDKKLFLVLAIKGTYSSSKLEFLVWIDHLERPMFIDPVYDRHQICTYVLSGEMRRSFHFQRCIRR
ncbi:hypothetical protein [Brevibacillus fulvus]|uniref:Uncharacterized protein n=1 Tax=Brevibacillus fulvus TaxID=1125967 RepID=A0A939BWK3_9BACL|nr:hypothetical protein [Brevibacillus fulvus]MBM7591871.1 hypothetical protein [Brevibacillus fulvus]